MANKLFKKALMKVGLKPPANEQVSSKYLIRCYEYLDDVIRGGGGTNIWGWFDLGIANMSMIWTRGCEYLVMIWSRGGPNTWAPQIPEDDLIWGEGEEAGIPGDDLIQGHEYLGISTANNAF